MSDTRDYIAAQEAAEILRLSRRQVNRYGHDGRIRTMHLGRRVLYHRADCEALATELDVAGRPKPSHQMKVEVIEPGEALEYIAELTDKLNQAYRRIGQLESTVQSQQRLLGDTEAMQRRAETAEQARLDLEQERDTLHQALEDTQRRLAEIEAQHQALPEPPPIPKQQRTAWWRKLFAKL